MVCSSSCQYRVLLIFVSSPTRFPYLGQCPLNMQPISTHIISHLAERMYGQHTRQRTVLQNAASKIARSDKVRKSSIGLLKCIYIYGVLSHLCIISPTPSSGAQKITRNAISTRWRRTMRCRRAMYTLSSFICLHYGFS